MPGGGCKEDHQEMLDKEREALATGIEELDSIINIATSNKEKQSHREWAVGTLSKNDYWPVYSSLLATVIANNARRHGTFGEQMVRDLIREVAERKD